MMSEALNLKDLEKKAWRSTFQDGIWDIYLGLLLMAMGANAYMSNIGIAENTGLLIFIGMEIAAMVVLWAGKKYITAPRIGLVKFGQKRRGRVHLVRLLLAVSVVLGFIMWGLFSNPNIDLRSMKTLMPIIWAANCLIVFGGGAYLLDYNRLYIIGVLYAIAIPINEVLIATMNRNLSHLALGIPGVIVVGMGLVVLARFLQSYPILNSPPEEIVREHAE